MEQSVRIAEAHISQRKLARKLAVPVLDEFARSALTVLKNEGVRCREAWLLPRSDAKFTLDKARSGLFRKVWKVQSSGFLLLSRSGSMKLRYQDAGRDAEDKLLDSIAVGGAKEWVQFRESISDDHGLDPRLWLNTDTSKLSVISASSRDQVFVTPFLEYGASAVEALVAGWGNRRS